MRFFLSSGGTGGHIFPAESFAEELINRGHEAVLITDKRYKNYEGNVKKFTVIEIPSATPKGGLINKLKALVEIILGIIAALKILYPNRNSVVIGFGGYPSFPAIIAAKILRMKTIIHEQNSVLGTANKVLAGLSDVIATSFPDVGGIAYRDRRKIFYVGNPVRPAIAALYDKPYPEMDGGLNILVMGGSLGASIFGQVVPLAVKKLGADMQRKIKISQQARQEDIENVKKAYAETAATTEIAGFFIDVSQRLEKAHLVISRSGASTVAELLIAGKPSILVPYPNSKGNHQLRNAQALEDVGGARIVDQKNFNADNLRVRLEDILKTPHILKNAAENIRRIASPGAAKRLADLAEKLAEDKSRQNIGEKSDHSPTI